MFYLLALVPAGVLFGLLILVVVTSCQCLAGHLRPPILAFFLLVLFVSAVASARVTPRGCLLRMNLSHLFELFGVILIA
jgi:hypothetical protein